MVPSDLIASGTRAASAWSAETLGGGADELPRALPPLLEEDEPPPQPVSARAVTATAATAAGRNGLLRCTGTPSPDQRTDLALSVSPVVNAATWEKASVWRCHPLRWTGRAGAGGSVGGLVHPVGAVDLTGAGQVVGVDDRVRVALLGEEPLPVSGVLGVEGVAADHRVEVRLTTVGLRPQDAPG